MWMVYVHHCGSFYLKPFLHHNTIVFLRTSIQRMKKSLMLICGNVLQMFNNIKYKIKKKYAEVKFGSHATVVQWSIYSSPKVVYWKHTSCMKSGDCTDSAINQFINASSLLEASSCWRDSIVQSTKCTHLNIYLPGIRKCIINNDLRYFLDSHFIPGIILNDLSTL